MSGYSPAPVAVPEQIYFTAGGDEVNLGLASPEVDDSVRLELSNNRVGLGTYNSSGKLNAPKERAVPGLKVRPEDVLFVTMAVNNALDALRLGLPASDVIAGFEKAKHDGIAGGDIMHKVVQIGLSS